MSTRRRIGISTATTEAARRQLMQPVPCWEKVWVTYEEAPSSNLKVYKWVKTEKKQQFSDDEEEPDLPLAPLPDEPEGFEDLDQDEQATSVGAEAASRAVSEPVAAQETEDVTPALPKPHPLSMSLVPDSPTPAPEVDGSVLDGELKTLEPSIDVSEPLSVIGDTSLRVPEELSGDIEDIDMTQLGPDGTQFEETGDLSQLQAADSLLGGEAMNTSDDPFQSVSIE